MVFKVTRSKGKKMPSSAKRSGTKKATTPRRGARPQADAPSRTPYVEIAEQDVVLLQTTNLLGARGLQDIVFRVFAAETGRRRAGATWLAFYTTGMPHHAGKAEWIGLSQSVPLATVDLIQAAMRTAGLPVERELGRALHLDLNPFARLSEDGLEILVPAALAGDPAARRVIERDGTRPVARGYTLRSDKAEPLRQLVFGSTNPSSGRRRMANGEHARTAATDAPEVARGDVYCGSRRRA